MLRDEIRNGESKTLELKSGIPGAQQVAKAVCAFANRAGGTLVFGVADDRTIVGMDESKLDEEMNRLANLIHDSVLPMLLPEIYTVRIEDRTLLVVRIYPGSATPYYLKSKGKAEGTYIRIGATNRKADPEILQELERNRLHISYDEDLSGEAEPDRIRALEEMLSARLHRPIGREQLVNLDLLKETGGRTYFAHAAGILLGLEDACTVQCARFLGDSVTEFYDRKEYRGDLFSVYESILVFLKNHLHLRGVFVAGSPVRKDELEIPESVLREAVLNALIHRDYSLSGTTTKVAVYDSRIEIVSPGGFPKTITVDEILAGRSEIRNRLVARVFKEAGMVEGWGSGVVRMFEACRAVGLGKPTLQESGLFVVLTIPRRVPPYRLGESAPEGSAYDARPSKSRVVAGERGRILEFLRTRPDATREELARVLGISASAVARRLEALQEEGRVVRTGSRKSGRWVVRDGL